jgi:hypothetical protein
VAGNTDLKYVEELYNQVGDLIAEEHQFEID